MENILEALFIFTNPSTLLVMFLGVVIGLIFGVVPALTATLGVAFMIPVSFALDPIKGTILLLSVYTGGISGGLVPAILLRIPGTASSVTTCFDGFPMTKKGHAAKALALAVFASFCGGIFSTVTLMFLGPIVAKFAVKFGPIEYFALAVCALTTVAGLSEGVFLKGLIGGLFGILITCVGISPIDGHSRFTFGIEELYSGFPLLPVLVGIFAFGQILREFETLSLPQPKSDFTEGLNLIVIKEVIKDKILLFRSMVIGLVIGMLPGVGGATSNIIAYNSAKQNSKYPEKFGTGIAEGIIAPESANNATIGGALITCFSLGIPGDTATAVLLGGLMIHGLQPGPLFYRQNPTLMYCIFISLFIINFLMVFCQFFGIKIFAQIINIPKFILLPIISVFCVLGAYLSNNLYFDCLILLLFGGIGYFLEKNGVPLVTVVIGYILGSMAEMNLRKAFSLTRGELIPFFQSPIALLFFVLTIFIIISTYMKGKGYSFSSIFKRKFKN